MSKRGAQTPQRKQPEIDGRNAEFYEYSVDDELRFQRCLQCSTWRHPPRLRCAHCGSAETAWEPSSRLGTIWSWTVTHQLFDSAMAGRLPYASVVVEVAEGPRVVALLDEAVDPASLRIGMPVRLDFEHPNGPIGLLVCRIAG